MALVLPCPLVTLDCTRWLAALGRFERFADQKVSYTDALSFILMRRENIREAFSFDRHFALAGFALWPA